MVIIINPLFNVYFGFKYKSFIFNIRSIRVFPECKSESWIYDMMWIYLIINKIVMKTIVIVLIVLLC